MVGFAALARELVTRLVVQCAGLKQATFGVGGSVSVVVDCVRDDMDIHILVSILHGWDGSLDGFVDNQVLTIDLAVDYRNSVRLLTVLLGDLAD
jgi:hypothetical protein